MTFHHELQIPVRWGDMDAYGHVNNTVFFRYLESGRFKYVEDLIMPELGGRIPVVVLADIQCKFEAQIHYPATLTVKTKISRLGRSSFDVTAEIWNGSKRAATSKAVMVWLDGKTYQPCAIPEAVAALIRKLEGLED